MEEARAGRLDIERELRETFEYLAIGAAAAINLFNPQAILLCSRMFDATADGFDRLGEMIRRRSLKPLGDRCAIVRAQGDTSRGAIASIIHHITGSIGPSL